MYLQHSLTGKYSETLALQNKNKHKILFNCFMTSHAFQKVTLQNADNSELNFLGWKKWRQQKPDHRRVLGQHLQVPLPRKRQASAATAELAVPPGRGFPRWPSPPPFLAQLVRRRPRGNWELKCFFFGSPAPKPTFQLRYAKVCKGCHTTNLRCWETAGKRQVESKINE